MRNLVEKFTSEDVQATDEDGVVAIEYVIMAGLVAIGVALTFGSTLWAEMKVKLDNVFS
jgi:Flp pilus assembly pilin Flp